MATALVRPHPLSAREQRTLEIPEGLTLADIVQLVWPAAVAREHAAVFIGAERVPPEQWARVRPKPGAVVRMALTLSGGDGGGKQIATVVAMIVIAIASQGVGVAAFGAGTWGAAATAAGLTMAGSLAIQAMFKPPDISTGKGPGSPAESLTYSFGAQANVATPYQVVPRLYGTHRIFPRIAALPYATNEGPNQYLYMLLDAGYGPLDIRQLFIGDTPLSNFRDVTYVIHPEWKAGDALEIYRRDTSHESIAVTLKTNVPEIRISAADAANIALEFAFPRGLVHFNDAGNRTPHTVGFQLGIRPSGSTGAFENVIATRKLYSSLPFATSVNIGGVTAYGQDDLTSEQQKAPDLRMAQNFTGFKKGRTKLMIGLGTIAGSGPLYTPPTLVAGDILYLFNVPYTVTGVTGGPATVFATISPPLVKSYLGFQAWCPVVRPTTNTIFITDSTAQPLFLSINFDVEPGPWEVKVTRTTAEATDDRTADALTWYALRSVSPQPVIATRQPHTIIELKMRANDQLSGAVQNVNCIATAVLPVYDGAVPPPGAVHFDFLTDTFQPIYGGDLATLAMTRGGAATRVNASGLLETVPADVPRFDYDPRTRAPLGLLIEEGRTNLLRGSNDFTAGGGWSLSGLVPIKNAIGPDGALSAWTVTDDSAGAFESFSQVLTVPNNAQAYMLSIFAKKQPDPNTFGINFNLTGGTAVSANPRWNLASGVASGGGGSMEDWGEFWRLLCPITNNSSGNTTLTVSIYPATSTNVGTGVGIDNPAAMGSVILADAQVEAGFSATSYIPTTTAAQARNPDAAVDASIGNFFNATEGTVVVEFDRTALLPAVANRYLWVWAFDDGTSNERLGVFVNDPSAGKQVSVLARDGGVNVVNNYASASTVAVAPGVPVRTAFSWKANQFFSATNGSAGFPDTVGALPTVSRLIIGGGDLYHQGHIRKFTYYPSALSSAQVVALSLSGAVLAPGMWVDQPTRNPAWAYLDALRGNAALRPLADARIDFDALNVWAKYCDTLAANGIDGQPEERVRFDHVVDYATTTFSLLQSIAAAGRATPTIRDGRHGVIVDAEQTVPVQLFTPRNSWGFNARRAYLSEPDGLRVKFTDPLSWQEGEVVLYAAGFNGQNAVTFEELKLFGVTRHTQATRDGRYMKAQALLRREQFEIQCDVESLIATRGDLVAVQHDVLEVGGDSTRVVSLTGSDLKVADIFGVLPSARYGLRIRLRDGAVTPGIEAVPIAQDTWRLSSVPSPAPAEGDLLAWGYLTTETGEYLVKNVKPGPDFTAALSLVEIARDIYHADTGEIPDYVPPAGGRDSFIAPAPERLRAVQLDKTIGREPYADVVLYWDQPSGAGYSRFKIFRVDIGGVQTQIAEALTTSVQVVQNQRLLDADVLTTVVVYSVIGIDAVGQQSEPAFIEVQLRDPLFIPDAPGFLSSNLHDKTTTLTWTVPANSSNPGNGQVLFYEVRWVPLDAVAPGAQWGQAARVTELVPWNVTTVTVPSRNGTYLVKSITASRVECEVAAVTVTAVDDLVIQDLYHAINFDPAWTGIFDGTVVDASGRLTLAPNADGTFPPYGVFQSDNRELFNQLLQCRITSRYEAQGINAAAFMADWVPLAIADPLAGARRGVDWDCALWVNSSAAAPYVMADWVPLASADPLDPIPAMSDADWRPLLAGEYAGRELFFALVLESMHPNVTPAVSHAGVDIDFPERRENYGDIAIPAAGLDFVFAQPFVFPPAVAIDLQAAAPGDFVQRGPVGTGGVHIAIKNGAAAIAGVVDVSAFGVGRQL